MKINESLKECLTKITFLESNSNRETKVVQNGVSDQEFGRLVTRVEKLE